MQRVVLEFVISTAHAGDSKGVVTIVCINNSSSAGLDSSAVSLQVVAETKAHTAEVSAIAFFSSVSSLPSPSSATPTAVVTASTQREGGGGGIIKVFLIPNPSEGGAGGLVYVRVYTGISCAPVRLQVTSCPARRAWLLTCDMLLQCVDHLGWFISGGSDGYLR